MGSDLEQSTKSYSPSTQEQTRTTMVKQAQEQGGYFETENAKGNS